jgi:hypothetical protein
LYTGTITLTLTATYAPFCPPEPGQ